jgi:hypothetical protein
MAYHSLLYETVPLNLVDIPQSVLDIENKSRSNPLKWSGQFSPQLVQALLKKYGDDSSRIYDPFLGSGTVLLEAGRLGMTACGSEINPAAVILARTYEFINVTILKRRYVIDAVESALDNTFPLTLFSNSTPKNGENALEQASSIRRKLLGLHKYFNEYLPKQLIEALIILVDFHKEADLSTNKIFKVWNKLKSLVLKLPFNLNQIAVFHSDARKTPLADSTIDLILTSPPYINVFNYHQQYRRSAESLNWNLLEIAKSEFGSNRKHRGNRFLTVTQYCLDIAHTLNELSRVSTRAARIIFVVGRESKVRGTPFYNSAIFVELAQKLGYTPLARQERKFKNRFGNCIYEDIIHLKSAPHVTLDSYSTSETARIVAFNVLNDSLSYAPENAAQDLKDAIDNIPQVKPSPFLINTTSVRNGLAHAK